MSEFNELEMGIIEQAGYYKKKEYLKSLAFIRGPMLFLLKLYGFVAFVYLIAQDVYIVQKEIHLFSWSRVFAATSIVLFYERAIAFQVINKLRMNGKR